MLTRLLSSNILQIHLLCSNEEDINTHMKQFYCQLLVCGYQQDLLIPAFTKGIKGANEFKEHDSVQQLVTTNNKDTEGHVFLHLTYHRKDPTSKKLQHQ